MSALTQMDIHSFKKRELDKCTYYKHAFGYWTLWTHHCSTVDTLFMNDYSFLHFWKEEIDFIHGGKF